jgi:hypothetical protein
MTPQELAIKHHETRDSMRIIQALLLCSLALGSISPEISRAQETPPEPASPDDAKLVVFELFTRYG